MAADAAEMIRRGMNHVQASELATQIAGTAAGNTGKLIALGFSVPLANELTRQMVAGVGTATNLMALGMPPALAKYCADEIELTSAE
jgi:hypothetical protein